jgi:hypothetical protein
MQGVSGLLDSTGRLVKLLRRCYGGQCSRAAIQRWGRKLGRWSKAAGGAGGSGRLQCGGRAQGGLKGPIKREAGGAPMGIAAVIRAGEADRTTARRDPGLGKEAS